MIKLPLSILQTYNQQQLSAYLEDMTQNIDDATGKPICADKKYCDAILNLYHDSIDWDKMLNG
jgi:hypothetical protein